MHSLNLSLDLHGAIWTLTVLTLERSTTRSLNYTSYESIPSSEADIFSRHNPASAKSNCATASNSQCQPTKATAGAKFSTYPTILLFSIWSTAKPAFWPLWISSGPWLSRHALRCATSRVGISATWPRVPSWPSSPVLPPTDAYRFWRPSR